MLADSCWYTLGETYTNRFKKKSNLNYFLFIYAENSKCKYNRYHFPKRKAQLSRLTMMRTTQLLFGHSLVSRGPCDDFPHSKNENFVYLHTQRKCYVFHQIKHVSLKIQHLLAAAVTLNLCNSSLCMISGLEFLS